jgi:hypothetical protein
MTKIGRIAGKGRAIMSVHNERPALIGGVFWRVLIKIIET